MIKTAISRRITREYVLTKADEQNVLEFLEGQISCRELGKRFGVSHQTAINLVSAICREWVQNGKLVFKKK